MIKRVLAILIIAIAAVAVIASTGCKKQTETGIEKLKKAVTKEDVDKKVKEIENSIKIYQKGRKLPPGLKNNLYKQAKEMLERDRKTLLAAEKNGVKVTDEAVNKKLAEIKKMLNRTKRGAFSEMLKKQNKTEEQFKEMLQKQLIFEELRKKLSKGIEVSDKELKDFYGKNKNYFMDPKDKKKIRAFDQVKGLIEQMLISQKVSQKMNDIIKNIK